MNRLSKIVLMLTTIALSLTASSDDYLLYWQVLDTATVNGITINDIKEKPMCMTVVKR